MLMRRLSQTLIPMAMFIALVMAAPSGAHNVPHTSKMTKAQQVTYYRAIVQHDQQQIVQANHVFRFFEKHSRLLANAKAKNRAWIEIKKWRAIKRNHLWQLHWAQKRLAPLLAPPSPCGGLSGNRLVGCTLGAKHAGWDTKAEWSMVDFIITHESGWRTDANNPSSTACGLGQMITGCAHSDVVGQFMDFIWYIGNHYHGSLSAAYAFWLAHSWY